MLEALTKSTSTSIRGNMTNDIGPVLITGATGNTGSQLLRVLASSGVTLHGMVRRVSDGDRLPAAVRPVVADFDDVASLDSALASVGHVYLVTPSSERAEQQQLDFLDRAAAAGVQRIVLLSQLGAREDSPVRFLRYHAVVENRLGALGVDYTILRPNLYFQGRSRSRTRSSRTAPLARRSGRSRSARLTFGISPTSRRRRSSRTGTRGPCRRSPGRPRSVIRRSRTRSARPPVERSPSPTARPTISR